MRFLNKPLLKSTAIILAIGIGITSTAIKLPNNLYTSLGSKKISTTITSVLENDCFDPKGDRFYVNKSQTNNYGPTSRTAIQNNTIKICLDKGLPNKYVDGANEAIDLYKKIFEIVNPNIKIEEGSPEDYNIYIRKENNDTNNYLMLTTGTIKYGKKIDNKENWQRLDNRNIINIYPLADQQDKDTYSFAIAHELGHAICGLNDYNKDYSFEEYGYNKNEQPNTIMNYTDISYLPKISTDTKITVLDLALIVKQWGLFSDNGIDGENPFQNEQEYHEYIDSRLNEVCYNDNEIMILNDINAAFEGGMTIPYYLKLLNENKDNDMFPNLEEDAPTQ